MTRAITLRRLPCPPPRGLTLIELMVAVAVVAIVMAVAYPSYQDQIRGSRRADAQAVLMEAAHFMERFATENQRYDKDLSGAAVALPPALSKAPKAATNPHYSISLSQVAEETYTLSAVPQGAQASDGCETLTIDQAGRKTASKAHCWRQ